MDVSLTLDDNEIDRIVVERLEEAYGHLAQDLRDREERSDSLAIYKTDRQEDIKAIKKMMKHLKKASSHFKENIVTEERSDVLFS